MTLRHRVTVRGPRGHAGSYTIHMTWQQAIEQFLTWLAAAGTAPGTIKLRRSYLHRLRRAFPDQRPGELSGDDLATFVAQPGWAAETRKSARATVRSFYRWAVLTGRLTTSPADALPPVRVSAGRPRPAPQQTLSTALALAPRRERVLLMLAAYAGLRCHEIAKVHTDHIADGQLLVRGKGGRERVVPLHPALLAVIGRAPRGFLFPGHDHGHLSAQRVSDLLSDLLGPGWTAHTLRHRFASLAYQNGGRDLRAVQELLGHSKPETTAIYTAVPAGALLSGVLGAGPQ